MTRAGVVGGTLRIALLAATVAIAADGFVSNDPRRLSWSARRASSSSGGVPSSSSIDAVPPTNDMGADGSATATESATTAEDGGARESYLLLAAEAYQKYYSKRRRRPSSLGAEADEEAAEEGAPLSREEYLELAMAAWSDGLTEGEEGNVDGGGDDAEGRTPSPSLRPPDPGDVAAAVSRPREGPDDVGANGETDDGGVDVGPNGDGDERSVSGGSGSGSSSPKENGRSGSEVGGGSERGSNPLLDMFSSWMTPAGDDATSASNKSPSSASGGGGVATTKFDPMSIFFKKREEEARLREGTGGTASQEGDAYVPYGLRTSTRAAAKTTAMAGERRPMEPDMSKRRKGGDGGASRTTPDFEEGGDAPYGLRVTKGTATATATATTAVGERRPVEPDMSKRRKNDNSNSRRPVEPDMSEQRKEDASVDAFPDQSHETDKSDGVGTVTLKGSGVGKEKEIAMASGPDEATSSQSSSKTPSKGVASGSSFAAGANSPATAVGATKSPILSKGVASAGKGIVVGPKTMKGATFGNKKSPATLGIISKQRVGLKTGDDSSGRVPPTKKLDGVVEKLSPFAGPTGALKTAKSFKGVASETKSPKKGLSFGSRMNAEIVSGVPSGDIKDEKALAPGPGDCGMPVVKKSFAGSSLVGVPKSVSSSGASAKAAPSSKELGEELSSVVGGVPKSPGFSKGAAAKAEGQKRGLSFGDSSTEPNEKQRRAASPGMDKAGVPSAKESGAESSSVAGGVRKSPEPSKGATTKAESSKKGLSFDNRLVKPEDKQQQAASPGMGKAGMPFAKKSNQESSSVAGGVPKSQELLKGAEAESSKKGLSFGNWSTKPQDKQQRAKSPGMGVASMPFQKKSGEETSSVAGEVPKSAEPLKGAATKAASPKRGISFGNWLTKPEEKQRQAESPGMGKASMPFEKESREQSSPVVGGVSKSLQPSKGATTKAKSPKKWLSFGNWLTKPQDKQLQAESPGMGKASTPFQKKSGVESSPTVGRVPKSAEPPKGVATKAESPKKGLSFSNWLTKPEDKQQQAASPERGKASMPFAKKLDEESGGVMMSTQSLKGVAEKAEVLKKGLSFGAWKKTQGEADDISPRPPPKETKSNEQRAAWPGFGASMPFTNKSTNEKSSLVMGGVPKSPESQKRAAAKGEGLKKGLSFGNLNAKGVLPPPLKNAEGARAVTPGLGKSSMPLAKKSGAEPLQLNGGVPQSSESLKGAIVRGEVSKKGLSFGSLKVKGVLPSPLKDDKGTQAVTVGPGKSSMPFMKKSGAESLQVMGGVPQSPESPKGAVLRGEIPKKGLSFGNLMAKGAVPPSLNNAKGAQAVTPGLGQKIPITKTKAGTEMGGVGYPKSPPRGESNSTSEPSPSILPSKGQSFVGGPMSLGSGTEKKGLSLVNAVQAKSGILTRQPLKGGGDKQAVAPGPGRSSMPFMKQSAAKTFDVGGVAKPPEPLKGAAAKGEGLKKGLSFGNWKAKVGGVSPQPPSKDIEGNQAVSPEPGKASMSFMIQSVAANTPPPAIGGATRPLESLKGAAKGEGAKKGLSFGDWKAKSVISPQPQPVSSEDKQSADVPLIKKSSSPFVGSDNLKTGDRRTGDGLDSFNPKKGMIKKKPNSGSFLVGLKQASEPNQIDDGGNSKTSSAAPKLKGVFPVGMKTIAKGSAPKEVAATLFSKGRSKQMTDFVPPPSPEPGLPASKAEFGYAAEDSEGSKEADIGADETQATGGKMSMSAVDDEPWLEYLGDIIMGGEEEPALPLLHIGNRVRSSVQGTTHEGFLFLSAEDTDGGVDVILNGNGYKVIPCIAKRPWSIDELNASVPSKVMAFEQQRFDALEDDPAPESWELDARAGAARNYYEVEIHVFQKFEQKKALYEQLLRQKQQDEERGSASGGRGKDENDNPPIIEKNVANIVVPKFLRVYPDDGSGGPRADDAIPEYGSTGLDVWGKPLVVGHEWLVFEGRLDAEFTLAEAMEIQHQADEQKIENGRRHHLRGVQQAMNLPDSYDFGDVMDAVFRCLLEDLVFLSSCNIVHRDLRPGNILCDGESQRLRLTNFGNAVDLDPPRVGLENSSLELEAPGSIANTLAADVFSVALIMCQLLFDVSGVVLNRQLKDVGYALDLWLQKALTADSCPPGFDDALDYLRDRPGLLSLLKGAIRPNPLRKKITSDSLRQFNEVLSKTMTDERNKKIAIEESVLEPNKGVPPTEVLEAENQESNKFSAYTDNEEAFDITRAPYKLKPPTKSSVSVLLELQRKAELAAPTAKISNNAEAATKSGSEYVDVTRLKFSPTRTSLLTNMLASYAKKRATVKASQKRKVPKGTYYDITRTPFRRVSPQRPERKITQSKVSPSIQDGNHTAKTMELVRIIAPAGKLGVVVDSPPTGRPVYVSSISDSSPLRNQIYLGDIIIAVDDEDVQRLVAEDVSLLLLSKSANAVREVSVLREIGDEEELTVSDDLMRDTSYGNKFAQTDTGKEMENEERCKEVEQWLSSYLPNLSKDDASHYCRALTNDGFDSPVMLEELIEDDLYFMKTAHRRVMSRKLWGLTNAKTRALPSASDEQSLAVKRVYKVDEALGMAARLGIEQKINEARKRAEAERKIASQKAETAVKRNKGSAMEQEANIKADVEAQRRTIEKEKIKLQKKLEFEAEARGRARQDELERLQDEAMRSKETEAWIAEQNELVKKRHRARIPKEKQLKEEEDRYATRQAELKGLDEEKERLEETEAWIAEQNELVKKRHRSRLAREKQLKEEEEADAAGQLEDGVKGKRLEEEAWITEQNELAKKRHLVKIAEENKLEGKVGGSLDLSRNQTAATREGELIGSSPVESKSSEENLSSTKQFYVTEGLTAEEAQLVRKARLAKAFASETAEINISKKPVEDGTYVKDDTEAPSTTTREDMVKLQKKLESEAAARGRARQDELERLQVEKMRLKETETWIAEQNELVKKRHRARIAKEKQLKEEEDRYATRKAELKSLVGEKKRLEETEAWIAEQNELVKKRHRSRIAREKQLKEEEEAHAAGQLEDGDKGTRLEEEA